MNSPTMRIGAAATAILILFAWSIFDTGPAWAQVVRAFNRAPDVHIVRMDTVEPGVAVNSYEAWIKDQNLFRVETEEYSIVDDGRRVLTLYKGLKVAHVRESFSPYWDYTPVVLRVFQRGQSQTGITVAEKSQERTDRADVYSVDFRGHWTGTAWVDRVTNLPLRIVGEYSDYVGPASTFETRFDYEPVADSLFATSIPPDYREIPNVADEGDGPKDYPTAVAGMVVDSQGHGVAGARIFASYAAPGQTDVQGAFALAAPPTDGSQTIGPSDLPLFIWAYTDADPGSVAWTVIRPPSSDDARGRTEKTHQGVILTIVDEADYQKNLPGSPGRPGGDGQTMDGNPQILDVVLVAGPAGLITGRVTDANGIPVPRALVLVGELELQIGSNRLVVSRLHEEWKAGFTATTDDAGRYSLGHLPISWTRATLVAKTQGQGSAVREVSNAGQNTACDMVPTANAPTDATQIEDLQSPDAPQGRPIRGGADVVSQVVPAGLCSNLMLYYSFEIVADKGIVSDISGNDRFGRRNGARRVEDASLGGCMSFAGGSDGIAVPDITLHQFTFCSWVNSGTDRDDLNNRPIFRLAEGDRFYSLQGNTPGGVGICVARGREVNEENWALAKGAWTHVAVTCDGSRFGIYRNGVLTETGEMPCESLTATLYIGATGDTKQDGWVGLIDEVALFNRALSPEEVKAVFEMTGIAVPDP